jgi:UDP-arabinose 4-epimerase
MKVLVTGGAGYIGSHTCKALHQAGHQPIVVDNLVYGHEWAVKWGPLHKLDIRETKELTSLLEKEKPEAVIHFAAFAYVGESVKEPEKYYDNNVRGSESLLKAMTETGTTKIVFSSTCATYGIPKTIKQLGATGIFSATALRYFNAAGADPDLEIGEDHDPETHLIPLAIEAAYKKNRTLTVFGDDYPTQDGTCVRDYIHVSDLANAHVLALEKISPGFRAYNLGTGNGNSVKEVLDSIEKACGKKVPHDIGKRREGDPPELVANAELAKSELDWNPHHGLDSITKTAAEWYRKHLGGTS